MQVTAHWRQWDRLLRRIFFLCTCDSQVVNNTVYDLHHHLMFNFSARQFIIIEKFYAKLKVVKCVRVNGWKIMYNLHYICVRSIKFPTNCCFKCGKGKKCLLFARRDEFEWLETIAIASISHHRAYQISTYIDASFIWTSLQWQANRAHHLKFTWFTYNSMES